MLYVTHSASEVARLADTLAVMEQGRVTALGPAASVLARIDALVMLGEDAGALLDPTVSERDAPWRLVRVDFGGGSLWLGDSGLEIGRNVRLRVLARDVSLTTEPPRSTSIQNLLEGDVLAVAPDAHPSQALVRVQCGESILLARATMRAVDTLGVAPGTPVWVQVESVALAT